MKNLQLPLKRNWFEMTASGEKREDYREINAYWIKRFVQATEENIRISDVLDWAIESEAGDVPPFFCFKMFKNNIMTLGYPVKMDTKRILTLEHKGISINTGRPEWGAIPDKLYFVIKHGDILVNQK